MRKRSRSLWLPFVLPLFLMQFSIPGCPIDTGGGTGGDGNVGGGAAFNLPPTAIITADRTRGVAPLTIQFSSANSTDDGLIISRRWDFGNGQTSAEISPRQTFDTTGTFTVRLTITDDANVSSSRTLTVVVTQSPTAVLNVDRTISSNAPAIFNFDASQSTDPDGQIVSYRWDFGDGSTEVLPVVAHTFAAPGTYRVRLTVTDNAGVTATADQLIEVGIPRPRISFRQPPDDVPNIVVTPESPLWVTVTTEVQPGVPRTIRTGLDRDRDPCDGLAAIYNVDNNFELGRLDNAPDAINDVAISANGQFIATGADNGVLSIYNAATRRLIRQVNSNHGAINGLAFSPDAATIALAQDDGSVVLINRANGSILNTIAAHVGPAQDVAFSVDGTRLGSAGDDNRGRIWNPANGALEATLNGHTLGVTSIAFSPVNSLQVLTGSSDRTARLWNASSGNQIAIFQPIFAGGNIVEGHSLPINAVAFGPDATRIATGSADRTAIIWDLASQGEVLTISGHSDAVTSVAFNFNGSRLATGSADRTARTWNTETGAEFNRFTPCASTVSSVVFDLGGQTLIAGVAARTSIQLDSDPPQGNDLNATIPTALKLTDVPIGQYSLWAEIDTDRTDPVRTYATAVVNVVSSFTRAVDAFTPRVPLLGDRASIVVAPTFDRQIFDIGPMSAGDRIRISFLNLPGYQQTVNDPSQNVNSPTPSVIILNASEDLFAWYDGNTFLTPGARLAVTRSSSSHFFVVDTGTSVDIQIFRAAGVSARTQRIFLDFRGRSEVAVGGLPALNIPALSGPGLNPAYSTADTAIIRSAITAEMRRLYGRWNVEIVSSDEGQPPTPPYQTLYFGGRNPTLLGIADYIDPRNETLTGSGLVFANEIANEFSSRDSTFVGRYIGMVAAHEAGHLLGLRHVENPLDIMDATTGNYLNMGNIDETVDFLASPLLGREVGPNGTIGIQDAQALFDELIGRRP